MTALLHQFACIASPSGSYQPHGPTSARAWSDVGTVVAVDAAVGEVADEAVGSTAAGIGLDGAT